MKRIWNLSLTACAVLFAVPAIAQTTFTLGVTGPDSKIGAAGDPWSDIYTGKLSAEGTGNGAQGWSISVGAENATITEATIAGTDAAALANGGFDTTELTTGAGNEGAVSAVVLSFTKPITLPAPPSSASIIQLKVEGSIPAGGGTARVFYVDNRKGSGQPVPNNVTQDSETKTPVLGELSIALREIVSCCGKPGNVGFSGVKLSSNNAYDGIVDADPSTCNAIGGQIKVQVAKGDTAALHAYANISSDNNVPGVQGWSLSIALNGDFEFGTPAVTTAGTPGFDENFDGGFEQTEAIDPAKNGGQKGAVSAVVLSFTKPRVLPPTSTKSVLDLNLVANAPQGDFDILGGVKFQSGLAGSGQPVENALTVNSETQTACNFGTASAILVSAATSEQSFVRGNANGDTKVDIADPIWIINQLFRQGPSSGCDAASDANGDGTVDAADATYLIAYEFQGGAAPPGGFPACDTASPETCAAGQSCP